MTDELAFCNPKVTCVVEADLATVWKVVQQWSTFYWLETVQGQPCDIQPYEGSENAIGSVRSVQIGDSLMFEKLVAMDEEIHTMKWRTIAHEDSITPFEQASYINTLITMNLREITNTNHTFVEWEAAFYTEQEFANEMHTALEAWIIGACGTLKGHLATDNPTVNFRAMRQPSPRTMHEPFPEDHAARFADLHISPGPGQQYGMPAHESMRYGPRGMAAPPVPDPRLQHPGKPMGTTSRSAPAQAPMVGASQPTMQAWQTSQAPPRHSSRRSPPAMSAESARAVQDWAARQQHEQHPQRHRLHAMGGSTYAPSLPSERSGSLDGMEPGSSRVSSRYQSRGMSQGQSHGMNQGRPDMHHSHRHPHEGRYEQPDLRQQWEVPQRAQQSAPLGATQSVFYEQGDMYDPRMARPSRSRPQAGQGQMPSGHRGSR